MLAPLPIPTILEAAKIAQYLSAIDIEESALFGASNNPLNANQIYLERNIIQYQYDHNPTDSTLRETTNYLWAIMSKGLAALPIIGVNNGAVINPSGSTVKLKPILLEFVVGTAQMNAGDTVLTINDSVYAGSIGITYNSGDVPSNAVNSYDFNYTPVFGLNSTTITFSQAVNDLAFIQVFYYKKIII